MNNLFDQMSDLSIKITGMAFALALEKYAFRKALFEYGFLTVEEIYEFHEANRTGNVNMIRRYLYKINDFTENINND